MLNLKFKSIDKEREINKSTFYALFFFYEKKDVQKGFLRGEVIF